MEQVTKRLKSIKAGKADLVSFLAGAVCLPLSINLSTNVFHGNTDYFYAGLIHAGLIAGPALYRGIAKASRAFQEYNPQTNQRNSTLECARKGFLESGLSTAQAGIGYLAGTIALL